MRDNRTRDTCQRPRGSRNSKAQGTNSHLNGQCAFPRLGIEKFHQRPSQEVKGEKFGYCKGQLTR